MARGGQDIGERDLSNLIGEEIVDEAWKEMGNEIRVGGLSEWDILTMGTILKIFYRWTQTRGQCKGDVGFTINKKYID